LLSPVSGRTATEKKGPTMTEQSESASVLTEPLETYTTTANGREAAEHHTDRPEAAETPRAADQHAARVDEPAPEAGDWHAEAGRKGARRVHQLIQEGKLYEQEHGLTSGRQRLRQLIELGKL